MIMQQNPITPIVGMPCCKVYYTDRYPYTVTGIRERNGVVVEVYVVENNYKVLDHYGEEYEILEVNTLTEPEAFTIRKNGRWVLKGQPQNGIALALNTHAMRIDPSF